MTTRRWWNAIQCFTPLLPRQGWLVRTVSLVRVRWALGTLRPRWATLLAALIDDEEVMECSEGWRRDVKTVMKCSAGRPLRLRRALHYVASTLTSLGKTTSLLTQTRAGGSEREPLP